MTSTGTPKRAVIYVRISRDMTGTGSGVGEQEKLCRDHAARLGYEVTAVYADNDISAFKGGGRSSRRPGYEQLLGDLRARRADAVIAWHTDRLHRDLPELEGYIEACGEGKNGIPTYTVQGGDLDLSTSSGRMIARILGAVARQEVEHMVERQRAGKQRNRDAGIRTGGTAPFGYRLDARQDRRQIPGVSSGLVSYEPEATAVRKAYSDILGGVSLYAIAKEWNQAGLRTARSRVNGGQPWRGKNVKRVLLCAANAGLIEYPQMSGKIAGKAKWEAIIDEGTWRAVRTILTDPSRQTPGPKPSTLLTGVLICGVCGSRRWGTNLQVSNRRRTYRCLAFDSPGIGATGHLTRDLESLDAYVEAIILERLSRDDVLTALRSQPDIDIPALDARRTVITTELEEWARTPGITPRQLQIRNEPLLAELADIDEKLGQALRGDPLPEFAGAVDPAEIWHGDPAAGVPPLAIERKRAVAAMLLRVRLQPIGRGGGRKPKGWRPGDPWRLDHSAIDILPPDA